MNGDAATAQSRSDGEVANRVSLLFGTMLVISVSALYLLTVNVSGRQSFDPISAALPAWQFARSGSLDLTAYRDWSNWIIQVHGHWYSNRFPGPIFWATPFYRLMPSTEPSLAPAAIAAVTSVVIGEVLLYRSLRTVVSRGLSIAMTACLAVATPLWSVAADALWTHGPAMMAISLILWGVSRRHALAATVGAAVSVLCRPHLAVSGIAMTLWLLRRGQKREALANIVGLSIGVALLLIYNRAVWGTFTILGGYDQSHLTTDGVGLGSLLTNILGALFSPSRGMLFYCPFLLTLAPFLRHAWKASPGWAQAACMAGLVYAGTQLYLLRFTGGNRFYSFRVLIESLVLCWPMVAIAAKSAVQVGKYRPTVIAVAIASVVTGIGATTNFVSTRELRPWGQVDVFRALPLLTPRDVVVIGLSTAALVWLARKGVKG